MVVQRVRGGRRKWVGDSYMDALPLAAAPCGFVPADNEIALQGSRKKDRRTGMVPILQALPCLPGT